MKNIHILPTDKPSRIYLIKKNNKLGITSADPEFTENFGSGTQNQYTYITSDEEINANTKPCWCINTIKNTWDKDVIYYQGSMPQYHFIGFKKIVLTTDQKLIDDGIQSIDDEFLEWFVKNQSCEEVEVQCRYNFYVGQDLTHYKIIIPKEEPNYNMKEEILDEMKRLEKEKQKQHLIDMMEADEELGLYNDDKPDTPEEAAAKEYLLRVNTKVHKDLMRDGYLKIGFVEGFRESQKISYNDSLDLFISEIKKEFNDTDWGYLDFIKHRIMENKFKKK